MTIEHKYHSAMAKWYVSQQGQPLAEAEQGWLLDSLQGKVGYYLLQLGEPIHSVPANRCTLRQVITITDTVNIENAISVWGKFDLLPFQSDTLDVVLLPHILEVATNAQAILDEAWRVLIPEGHLILLGFNPYSLWGLWRIFISASLDFPWKGKFKSAANLRYQLVQMGYEIVQIKKGYYRPPVASTQWQKRLIFLETLGKYFWPWGGASYLIVARKQIVAVTPIKMRWRWRDLLFNKRLVQPSARE